MLEMLVLVVLSADPALPSLSHEDASPRRYHEIHQDMRAAMRREATAASKTERAAAIHEMTQLYRELLRDPRRPDSEALTEYKNRLWSRLTRAKREIQRDLSKAEDQDPVVANTGGSRAVDEVTARLADSLTLLGQATGGPASLLSQLGGSHGGRAIPDYGPALVDLIERTIAPGSWDVHGGPGTIVYYAPLRVLVVRATSEVHHSVGGVLGGLRAAGR